MSTSQSPRIERLEWGKVTVDGGRHFKDAKLYPGGAREWNWKETGTHHSPGILPADVQDLLDHGATVVVLSRGQLGRLAIAPETYRVLAERGIEVQVHRTRRAVETYNRRRDRDAVGALIHSTC